MSEIAYFTPTDGSYLPLAPAIGPWSRVMLNGGAICGLLAYAIEQEMSEVGMIPARFSVELLREVKSGPLEVEVSLVRHGRVTKVVDATILQQGKTCARATCQFIQLGTQPDGARWSPADWDAAEPGTLEPVGNMPRDVRLVSGELRGNSQRRAWVRETREIVSGQLLTAFQRIAAISDFASPFSSSGSEGLSFINTDVSLAMHRLPVGQWVGVEVVDHQSADGIAVGSCRIYDSTGSVGLISTVGLSRRDALLLGGTASTGKNS